MESVINLNNIKVFTISDLMGGSSVRKRSRTDGIAALNKNFVTPKLNDKKKKRPRQIDKGVMLQPSSFKTSNKLAVHGNKPKKIKKSHNESTDVLWLHETKMKYFKNLQDTVLPKKKEELLHCENDPKKQSMLMAEIDQIERKEEELSYLSLVQPLVDEYMQMLESNDQDNLKLDTSGNITKYIHKYDNVEKVRITEEYCKRLNNGLMINYKRLKFDNTVCVHCNGLTAMSEGFITCTECGIVSDKSVQDFQLSYHDYQEVAMRNTFSYKRINRFQEILATLQAKENTEIPEFVMKAVQQEIAKEHNPDLSSFDNAKIKSYLKKLSLQSYYEHSPHILNKINGIPPIQIPVEVEDKLREMFRDIQEPFEVVKSQVCPNRLSFLSYNFVLYKFCELLDLEEYQKCFTLLKSIDKLRLQDKIWKGICKILEWEYIPSI